MCTSTTRFGNGLYRVFAITSRSAPGRAEVMFATTPSVDGNPNDPASTAIVLAQAGSSPQIETAWDLRVIRWTQTFATPNECRSNVAGGVRPCRRGSPSIRQANAGLGTHIAVGGYHLSVLALRGQTPDRAAWVEVSFNPVMKITERRCSG
jgi:hypothetical protein